MPELPSGTVTFLFTDIEGSTRLLKQLREGYGEVLATHRRLLRTAFADYGGQEIDTQGDAFFFAFARARDAAEAAAAGQRALAAHDWPAGAEIRVRMGLHTGEPAVGEEGYTGLGVHRAARICAAGHGGQVLLSNTTRELVEDELPRNLELRDLGEHRLKDLDRPEHIFELLVKGLRHDFPPLATLSEQPEEATPFAGREEELAAAATEAVSGGRRLAIPTLLIAALGAIVVLVAGAYVLVGRSSDADALTGIRENAVGVVDSGSGTIEQQIPVGVSPGLVAVGERAVWVTNTDDASVSRIDPASGSVRQTIEVGNAPRAIAVGAGAVWVVNTLDGTVSRIDPKSNAVVQTIAVGNHPTGIAAGASGIWVSNTNDATVSRIDPASGKVTHTFGAGGAVGPLAVGFGSLWAAAPTTGRLIRIDTKSRQIVEVVNVGNGPTSVTTGAGAVWVANGADGTVSRIDPATTGVESTVLVGSGGENTVAATADGIWATDEQRGTVARLDTVTGGVVEQVEVGNRPQGLALAGSDVYVAVRASTAAHRGGTLTAVTDAFDFLDPALAYAPDSWAILNLTNGGLTAFRRVGGGRGTELVPGLAKSLPPPTNRGLTYTFRLREGLRYSTGTLVRAGDVRAALERVLRNPDSPVRGFASSIVGAEACIARPRSCSLARGVVTNDEAGTVAFHLVRPDPELLQKLALPFAFPVPKGTPLDLGGRSVPATGPYMLAERTPTRLRLVRNPRFNVRSGAAQPDGVPDEIVWRFDPKAERRVEAVLSGRADFAGAVGSAPERLLDDLRTRFASQLHVDPVRATFYVALNTRRSPFDDPDVRRALNFAVDREELVRLFGGPDGARSTCQVLPPGLPGYVPYCPYTLRPASGGTWSGPDLAEARRLVARSGTRGTRITLSYTPRIPGASAGPYVASVLRALGYEVQLRRIADEGAYFSVLEAGAYGHAAPSGWFADYPSPSAFVAPQLGCSQDANATGFCSRRIDRQMRRALALQERDAQAAGAMWARIDRSVTDEAPWLSMVNLRLVNLVSERVGNYQSNPQWGVLVDQLWVR